MKTNYRRQSKNRKSTLKNPFGFLLKYPFGLLRKYPFGNTLLIDDDLSYEDIQKYVQITKTSFSFKTSRKASRKASRKTSRKTSRKATNTSFSFSKKDFIESNETIFLT